MLTPVSSILLQRIQWTTEKATGVDWDLWQQRLLAPLDNCFGFHLGAAVSPLAEIICHLLAGAQQLCIHNVLRRNPTPTKVHSLPVSVFWSGFIFRVQRKGYFT
jgi:hypothetical protein